MASINFVPGVGYVMNVAGTDKTMVLGSDEEQAAGQAVIDDRQNFLAQNQFSYDKDYSQDFDTLFGSSVSSQNPSFYSGPNPSWQGAMDDRLRKRRQGLFDGVGYYENSTQYMDRGLQEQMYRRNNAVEDLYRRGYDMSQIQAHMDGTRNILGEEPSWRDYFKEKQRAGDNDWTEDYFMGEPEGTLDDFRTAKVNQRLQDMDKYFTENNPFDKILNSLFGDFL
tara:strand:- start:841 stop:1509 length:669 start_codon:yes stop_codon:yes gene_type:complete